MGALGVKVSGSEMKNGEYRFRLMKGENNSAFGYILTEMPKDKPGEWQNSHFHKGIMETYIVQQGWIGYAELEADSTMKLSLFRAGQMFTTPVGVAHNVYMPSGAVIHTVKHGDCFLERDWFSAEDLDLLTKPLDEAEVLRVGLWTGSTAPA